MPLVGEDDTIQELLSPFWAFSLFALQNKVKKGLSADDIVM